MPLHYLVKYECQKTGGNLKYVAINDKSQGSTAKHLSCGELLHYKFITQFAIENKKIKSVNIWRSYKQNAPYPIPFALDFYPQRYRTRQISEIICV